MNQFDVMRDAISEAKTTMRAADQMAVDIAFMLVGRLRAVNNGKYHPRYSEWARTNVLKALKRELKNFDANTGKWKGDAS